MGEKEEKFLEKNSLDGGLFQSKYWADFQLKLNKNFYLIENQENQVLIIENNLPIVGKYFYIPRGPIISGNKKNNRELFDKIKSLAVEKGAGWIRIEPQRQEVLKELRGKFIKSYKNHQPAETLMLDLKQDEKEILAQMKQKTRYNIRLAQKKGVKIKISKDPKDLEIFWKLVQETADRDGVVFHSKEYYQKMFEAIPGANLELLIALGEDKPVGAIMVSYFSGVATYLHGASSDEDRNLMANYLVQWEAIKRAKEKGMKKYDFFGIAVKKNRKKWAGITRFKRGFCPNIEPIIFPGCYDFVISPVKYWFYRIVQLVK